LGLGFGAVLLMARKRRGCGIGGVGGKLALAGPGLAGEAVFTREILFCDCLPCQLGREAAAFAVTSKQRVPSAFARKPDSTKKEKSVDALGRADGGNMTGSAAIQGDKKKRKKAGKRKEAVV